MPEEAVHHIENSNQKEGKALHIFGGDFGAIMDLLWRKPALKLGEAVAI